MPVQVASLFGVLGLRDAEFRQGLADARSGLQGLGDNLQSIGGQVTQFGGALATVFGPLAAGFGVATNAAMSFDQSVTNTASLLGYTREQTLALGDELRAIGGDTVAGPQAVADAFYEIASGVNDTSTHMAILDAAISTSQAGQEDLVTTTGALIAVMNSYKFAADDASYASDVLSRTVGMGVGSMGEFATAFPNVTGLASTLGISFGDLGGQMAYLTTQGNSAAEASTQLSSIMVAFMRPNEEMKNALQELGFASGEAAIQQLGLVGALEAIGGTNTAAQEGIAGILGRVEALRGAISLTGDGATEFLEEFTSGIDGATAAMEEIQMTSPAATFALAKASLEEMAIAIGQQMLPVLAKLLEQLLPIIDGIMQWVGENPELVAQIGMLAIGGAELGGALMAVGTVVSAGGTLLAGLGALPALLAGPIAPILAIGAAIAGVIAQVNEFNRVTTEAAVGAGEGLAAEIQAGAITIQDAKDEFFRQAQEQHGDFLARVMLGQAEASGLFDQMFEAGNNAALGLSGGIEGATPQAEASAAMLANAAASSTASALGTQSPSTVFAGFGRDVVAGLAQGLTAGVPMLAVPLALINVTLATGWALAAVTLAAITPRILSQLDRVEGKLNSVAAAAARAAAAIASVPGLGDGEGLPGRAAGGPVAAGMPYLVGERGPEVYVPHTDGMIVPNGAQLGNTYNVTIVPQINPAAGPVGEQADEFAQRFMAYLQTT